MVKKFFHIIADFVDIETGDPILKGAVIEVDDEEREQSLRAAGVIGKEATKAQQGAAKKVDEKNIDDADKIAEEKNVDDTE